MFKDQRQGARATREETKLARITRKGKHKNQQEALDRAVELYELILDNSTNQQGVVIKNKAGDVIAAVGVYEE